MKIRKITLSKYKRFQSLTIDLGDNPKRIVALVGPNGCGKSSVFDGMLFLNNAYGGIGNKGNKDFHYHSIEQNPSYDYRNVSIQFLEVIMILFAGINRLKVNKILFFHLGVPTVTIII